MRMKLTGKVLQTNMTKLTVTKFCGGKKTV